MESTLFQTPDGIGVPAVTAAEMREIDRIAVDETGLEMIQMMEHAGRTLAAETFRLIDAEDTVTVVAGDGGNGGGGLACARHLTNRDYEVEVVLDRPSSEFDGGPATQLAILEASDALVTTDVDAEPGLVIDALVGYGLDGVPRGRVASLIERVTSTADQVISLDVPSGLDATTGKRPGVAVEPTRTITLALPKTGLTEVGGELVLGDISIPSIVYDRADVDYRSPFGTDFAVTLEIR